jgi:PAS domain S-box-containing protein
VKERLEKIIRIESALRRIEEKILAGADFQEALEIACDAVVEMGYRMCWVGLAEPDHSVRPVAVRGFEEGYLEKFRFRWDESPQGNFPAGIAIRTGKTYVCPDILTDPLYELWREMAGEIGYRSSATIPLFSSEEGTIGVLTVFSERIGDFPSEEILRLETFTRQCTIAFVNARRLEELRKYSQLQNVLNSLLQISLLEISINEQLERSLDVILSAPFLPLMPKGGIFLVESGDVLVLTVNKNLPLSLQEMCAKVPFGRCLCGRAAASRQIQFAVTLDDRHENRYDGIIPHGHYTAPILSKDKLLGVLVLYLQEAHRQEKQEIDFLQAVTDTLAGVIERKQGEEALQGSEKRYRHLVESVTDYIYSVKVENGRSVATYHGPGCVAVTGYTSEEFEADPFLWHQLVHEENRKAVTEHVNRISISGGAVSPLEYRITHKEGRIHWVRHTIVPRYDEQGHLIAYDGLIKDITEIKKVEEQLLMAQKMEAIGTLAGGVAHDFNNALTGILGFGEMLRMRLSNDPRAISDLDEIARCAERASTLTKQLLAFARRQIIEPFPFSLNAVVTDLLKLIRNAIGEHIEIHTNLGGSLPAIMADQGQIEQVLMNLCLNARDAMPEGGKLLIETEVAELDLDYVKSYPYIRAGRFVVLTLADTGIGMDEKTRERVFEPFFTTKEPGKGTGLGLSMVYGIVKQHNGFIHLYSEPGKGTSFKIYFPAIEAMAARKVALLEEPLAGGTETILLAEDEETVRVLGERVLKELGYNVLVAKDGEEACDVFEKNKEKIALAVLDVIMPRKGGKRAFEEMYRSNPNFKVIFTSSYAPNAIHDSFVLISGAPFLPKPYGPRSLGKKVREVLDS